VTNALQGTKAGKAPNPVANRLKKELDQVVGSKQKLMERIKAGKVTMERVGTVLVNGIEGGGSLLLASIAEGRWGTKIKLGGKVDARLLPSIPLMLAELWLTASGSPVASHVGSVGKGIFASYLSSVGREIGAAWGEKAGAPAPGTPNTGDDDPDLGALREMALTESELAGPAEEGRRKKERRANNRFIEAEAMR